MSSGAAWAMERGALGLVFRLSRVAGLAPIVRAPRYRVSRALLVYGAINVVVVGMYTICIVYLLLPKLMVNKWLGVDIMIVVNAFVWMTAFIVGVLTAPKRSLRMARYLEQLDELDAAYSQMHGTAEGKVICLLLTYVLAFAVIRPITFSPFKIQLCGDRWEGNVFLFVYMGQHVSIDLLIIEQALFARRVLQTLESVNDSLRQMLPDQVFFSKLVNEKLSVGDKQTIQRTLRRLAQHYMKICDVIRSSNSRDGFLMIILLGCYVLYMEKYLYKIILRPTNNAQSAVNFATAPVSLMLIAVMMICAVEPFHRTNSQMDTIPKLINALRCCRWNDEGISNELDLFVRLLALNRAHYAPLGVLTLQRSLVVTIYGGLITYLVTMITYGPEANT